MRNLLVIIFTCIGLVSIAQVDTYEKTVALKGERIDIDAELANGIIIKTWDKNEVQVKVQYNINGGELNEAVEIELKEQSHRVLLKVDVDDRMFRNSNYSDCKDENASWWGGRRGSRVCADIMIEISVPAKVNLDVESVLADILVEGEFKEVDIKTVTGDIDLTWPQNDGAEVELKTVNGGIYTDFKFGASKQKGLPVISSHEIETTIGDGSKYVRLETVTSDIFLRKG